MPEPRLREALGSMVMVRWVALPWALLLVVSRDLPEEHAYVAPIGLALVGALGVSNVGWWAALRRPNAPPKVIAVGGMTVDVLLAAGFVWLFTFDHTAAMWALLYLVPLEGALLAGLAGALWSWAATATLYVGRDLWGSEVYDYPLSWNSIGFRMGIGFLLALVAGMMARNLNRERHRLQAALEQLQRTDRLRGQLVASLGHDVRAPLSVIRMALQTIGSSELDRDTLVDLTRRAERQGARLQRVAVGLLELARMEEGRLELQRRPFRLLDAVTEALEFADPDGRVEVDVPPDLQVVGDADRIDQIIVNLVSNAFTHGKPPVAVTARHVAHRVVLEVWDHGPGLPEGEAEEDAFAPFRGLPTETSVGLGLTVVRVLVEAHGGEVAYRREGGRTCFSVWLPAPA